MDSDPFGVLIQRLIKEFLSHRDGYAALVCAVTPQQRNLDMADYAAADEYTAAKFLRDVQSEFYFSKSSVSGLKRDCRGAHLATAAELMEEYELLIGYKDDAVFSCPAHSNLLVKRKLVAAELEAALLLDSIRTRYILVQGTRGIGKTQLLLDCCSAVRSRFSAVWYMRCATFAEFRKDYSSFCRALGAAVDGDAMAEEVAAQALGSALTARGGPWLLVLDDMRFDLRLADSLIPGTGGVVLLSSRDAQLYPYDMKMHLGPLARMEYINLLSNYGTPPGDEGKAHILGKRLCYNPFAVSVFAKYANAESISISQLNTRLQRTPTLYSQIVTTVPNEEVQMTLEQLYAQDIELMTHSAETWVVVQQLALLSPDSAISLPILASICVSGVAGVDDMIREMELHGLGTQSEEGIHVDKLFVDVIRARMKPSEWLKAADALVKIFDGFWKYSLEDETTWAATGEIGRHLRALLDGKEAVRRIEHTDVLIAMLLEYSKYLGEVKGRSDAANEISERITDILDVADGPVDLGDEDDPGAMVISPEELDALPVAAELEALYKEKVRAFDQHQNNRGMFFQHMRSDDSNCGYVGLSNQGATCYLNTLIQVLFMCPDFKRLLFETARKNFSVAVKEESIPYQLALLFARMEIGTCSMQGTKALTKSFGWKYEDVIQQHDIMELFNLLLEALENVEFALSHLFEGGISDTVRCSECKNENTRISAFQSLSLPILDVKSLEGALTKYFANEEFKGENKYQCSVCDKKVKALKSTRIERFPDVLVLHLQRFDFHPRTYQRRKINKRVKFPFLLHLDKYSVYPDAKCSYMLCAVIVHIGSAVGGHYYAYIRRIEDDKWFCFNDSDIALAAEEDILSTFGGEDKSAKNGVQPTANAYILVYLRAKEDGNAGSNAGSGSEEKGESDVSSQIPEQVMDIVAVENKKVADAQETARHFANLVKMTFLRKEVRKSIIVSTDDRYSEIVKIVYRLYGISEEELPLKNFMLSSYVYSSAASLEFERDYDTIKGKTIGELQFGKSMTLLVENRDPNEETRNISGAGRAKLMVYTYDKGNKGFNIPVEIVVVMEEPMQALKTKLAAQFKIPSSAMRLFDMTREPVEITNSTGRIVDANLRNSSRVLLENGKTQNDVFHTKSDGDTVARTGILREEVLEYFKRMKNEMKLKLHVSDDIASSSSLELKENEVECIVDGRMTIREFRVRISEILKIPEASFKIMKGVKADVELKSSVFSLLDLHIGRYTTITVVKGVPLERNEALVVFLRCEKGFPKVHEARFFDSDKMKKLRTSVAAKLGVSNANCVRLREKRGDKVKSVFRDYQTLLEAIGFLSDTIYLAVDILESPEALKKKSSLVSYMKYSRKQAQQFSERQDYICSNEDNSLSAIQEMAAKLKIPDDKVMVAKVFIVDIFAEMEKTVEIHKERFFTMDDIHDAMKLVYSSMAHLHDGDVLIFKDMREDENEEKELRKKEDRARKDVRKFHKDVGENGDGERRGIISRILNRSGDSRRRAELESREQNRPKEVPMKISGQSKEEDEE